MATKERRIQNNFDEQKAYKSNSLKDDIKRERRKDNIERLLEIQKQKRFYYTTLGFCLLLNILLLSLGFIGLGSN